MTIKEAIVRGLTESGRGSWEENKDFIVPALMDDPNNDGSEYYAEWFAKSLEWYGTLAEIERCIEGYLDDEFLRTTYGWETGGDAVDDMLEPYAYGQYPWEVWLNEDEDIWFLATVN